MRLSLLIIVGPFCILVLEWAFGVMGLNVFSQALIILFTIITGGLFILIELPKILELTIDEDKIVTKNLLTGKTTYILFKSIDSFKIYTHFQPKSGLHFELILAADGKKMQQISLSYIDNQDQIIKELEKRLKNLTEDEYGLFQDVSK